MSKHLIMGTAGHVDHGKTTLIKALTGTDCDTHKQEKARGMTINLGFTYLDLPNGDSLGVVDVPGHRDFVHTMVGGASGIDFVLLLVAADEGVMPQTREHVQIMQVLGIRHGLVVLSKIDLVDRELTDLAEQEIRELLQGTFLEGCPMIRVSSLTGQGLDNLRDTIMHMAVQTPQRQTGEIFRLFVDRVFSVKGFGTVVTGSVISGSLHTEDAVYVLPTGHDPVRVRRLERHGQEARHIVAGDRASINLVGIDRKDIPRGTVLANRKLKATSLIDARISLFQSQRRLERWSQVIFHAGSYEAGARVHLLDCDCVTEDREALVQIHLSEPCVLQRGDRFVLRNSSRDSTLGGGRVIDMAPLHHRRRPPALIQQLQQVATGSLMDLVVAQTLKRIHGTTAQEIADDLNVSWDDIHQIITAGLPEELKVYQDSKHIYLIAKAKDERLRKSIVYRLKAFHKRNPLQAGGRTAEELTGMLGVSMQASNHGLIQLLLHDMQKQGLVKPVDSTWALTEHQVHIEPQQQEMIDRVERFLRDCNMQTPLMNDLTAHMRHKRMDPKELPQILHYLVSQQRIYHIDGNYLHACVVDRCRKILLDTLIEHPEGITVSQFRDLTGGNRKICLLLLAQYDHEKIVQRHGDVRMVTEVGRKIDRRSRITDHS